MNDTERKAVIALRLENAQQTLQEAKLLMDNAYWNAAINRMYYACYYAVSALLIKNGIQAQTHAGVRQMLGLHFVKTNLLSSKNNAFYSDLFAKRHSGDYDVYIYFDKDVTVGLYPQSIEFITAIEKLIKSP
ncbi:DNA-binding protein [Bacteroidia bacterium]|nr:DNA-binding protein [Bacteroidia bacterium]